MLGMSEEQRGARAEAQVSKGGIRRYTLGIGTL